MKKCQHKWKEDPMFASGVIFMVCGSSNDLGKETRVVCKKCGLVEYVRMEDLGSITDMVKEVLE